MRKCAYTALYAVMRNGEKKAEENAEMLEEVLCDEQYCLHCMVVKEDGDENLIGISLQ